MELTDFHGTTDIDEFNERHESESRFFKTTCYTRNNYNILRVLMFLVTLSSFFVTLLYGIGQLLTLRLDDYFCAPKSLEDIHQHSIANNLNEGDIGSCYTTNHYESDQQKTFYAGYMTAYIAVLEPSDVNIFYCIVFLSISLYLVIVFVYFMISLINDCCSQKVFIETSSQKNITYRNYNYHCNYLHSWIAWYHSNFTVDAKYWIIQTIHQQLLKLVIESIVFLQYGGTQSNILYTFHSNSDNNKITAEKQENVTLFAVFLALNFIFTATLWFCYLYKHRLCHGRFFYGLLFLFDAIFEIFYVIFPLFLLGDNLSFSTAAAMLKSKSFFTFIAVIVPLLFLCYKIFNVFEHLTALGRKQFYFQKKRSNSLELEESFITNHTNIAIVQNVTDPETISNITPKLKIYMISCNIIWIICGLCIIVFTSLHFNKNQRECNNYNNYMDDYPELYLWKHCNYKVYPFFAAGDISCNCRGFAMSRYSLGSDEGSVVDSKMVMSMFRHWYMLETLKFYADKNIININLTCNEMQSKNMRALAIFFINIDYIDEDCWTNWNNIQYLALYSTFSDNNGNLNEIPFATSTFTKLQHFELNYNNFDPESKILDIVCNFRDIGYISTSITGQLPNCIISLDNVEYIDMSGTEIVHSVDINLLSMTSLKKFSMISVAHLDINSFNIKSNDSFKFHPTAKYSFQGTALCLSFMGNKKIKMNNDSDSKYWSQVKDIYYNNLYNFLNETNACQRYCNYSESNWGDVASWWCLEKSYENGICDPGCNSFECHFDGGDCTQLCECDLSLLTNNKCDVQCNTTNCNYDMNQCVQNKNVDWDKCFNTTKCEKSWINDGFCDDYCRVDECNNDGEDCDICYNYADDVDVINDLCQREWNYFTVADLNGDFEIDVDEACSYWHELIALLSDQTIFKYMNCSTVVSIYDIDANNKMNGFEFANFASTANGQCTKIGSVNCSKCAFEVAQWYGYNPLFYMDDVDSNKSAYNLSKNIEFCNMIYSDPNNNNSDINNTNYKYNNSCFTKTQCEKSWIGDGWCDYNACYNVFCGYDGRDCSDCSTSPNCNELMSYFEIVANTFSEDDEIENNEACSFWGLLKASWDSIIFNHLNCTEAIFIFDLDNNDKLNQFELTNFASAADADCSKIGKVNCSLCSSKNISQYYGYNDIFFIQEKYDLSKSINFCNMVFASNITINPTISPIINPTISPTIINATLSPTTSAITSVPTVSCQSNSNQTQCVSSWINDGWCDENCRYSEICQYDGNDCNGTCPFECNQLWTNFVAAANLFSNDYKVQPLECDFVWNTLVNAWNSTIFNYLTCSTAISTFDLDNDNALNGFELANFASAADSQCHKIGQVNCSFCADSMQQFYANNSIFYDGSNNYDLTASINFCNSVYA